MEKLIKLLRVVFFKIQNSRKYTSTIGFIKQILKFKYRKIQIL